jgi:hypothetical protein
MEKLIVYMSGSRGARQYRIAPPDPSNRISDSDGWRFGAVKSDKVNFALLGMEAEREVIRESLGEVGLKFALNVAKSITLREGDQLIIVNAWTVIRTWDIVGSDEPMIKVIGKTLGRKIEAVEANEPVGTVF